MEEKFGGRSVHFDGTHVMMAPVWVPRIWIVSITSHEARVFSRVLQGSVQALKSTGHGQDGLSGWRLEPEVGMQLETFAHASKYDGAIRCQLSRLIGGVLSLAKAGGRFDQLVIVADGATRRHLRIYLNSIARASIMAELDEAAADDPEALYAALHLGLPSVFA